MSRLPATTRAAVTHTSRSVRQTLLPFSRFGKPCLTASGCFRKVRCMASGPPLQPTLWRTCRVIANRTRLRLLGLLVQQPGLTVSAVAQRLGQPLSLVSQYLRALEARGLLIARRVGRRVEYRPRHPTDESVAPKLARAIRSTFQHETAPVETVFRLATAFTHARRIEIVRALKNAPQTRAQLKAATGISADALRRHRAKLEARGFVTSRLGAYRWVPRSDALGRELERLAVE